MLCVLFNFSFRIVKWITKENVCKYWILFPFLWIVFQIYSNIHSFCRFLFQIRTHERFLLFLRNIYHSIWAKLQDMFIFTLSRNQYENKITSNQTKTEYKLYSNFLPWIFFLAFIQKHFSNLLYVLKEIFPRSSRNLSCVLIWKSNRQKLWIFKYIWKTIRRNEKEIQYLHSGSHFPSFQGNESTFSDIVKVSERKRLQGAIFFLPTRGFIGIMHCEGFSAVTEKKVGKKRNHSLG